MTIMAILKVRLVKLRKGWEHVYDIQQLLSSLQIDKSILTTICKHQDEQWCDNERLMVNNSQN